MAGVGPFTRLPRPPREIGDTNELRRWFDRIWLILSGAPGISWETLSKAGSNLTDIETRKHNDLQLRNVADAHPWDSITKTGSELQDIATRPHSQLTNILGGSDEYHVQATERNELIALDALASGIVVKTGNASYTPRTITGTAGEIEVSNGDGTGGNPTLALPDTISTPRRFGGETDYTEFEADGTRRANGAATTFTDLQGSVLSLEVLGTGVSKNVTENTVEFTTAANLSDYLFDNYQVQHSWRTGSTIHPHIHWEQAQNNEPNFLIQYRWQQQGAAKTTAWTNYVVPSLAFTYVSGTLNQISYGAGITPPVGAGLSDVIEFRVLRDNANTSGAFAGADPYTTTVGLTFVDIHIENDTDGSRTEYSK